MRHKVYWNLTITIILKYTKSRSTMDT